MLYRKIASRAVLAAMSALVFAASAVAQPSRQFISVLVDASGEVEDSRHMSTAADVRLAWPASRLLIADGTLSHARFRLEAFDQSILVPALRNEKIDLAAWTFSLQVEYPVADVRMYFGVATKIVGRLDQAGREPFLRTRVAFPGGVSYAPTSAATARGAIRLRFEEDQRGDRGVVPELRVAIGWRFQNRSP